MIPLCILLVTLILIIYLEGWQSNRAFCLLFFSGVLSNPPALNWTNFHILYLLGQNDFKLKTGLLISFSFIYQTVDHV